MIIKFSRQKAKINNKINCVFHFVCILICKVKKLQTTLQRKIRFLLIWPSNELK